MRNTGDQRSHDSHHFIAAQVDFESCSLSLRPLPFGNFPAQFYDGFLKFFLALFQAIFRHRRGLQLADHIIEALREFSQFIAA
jgi:hypothetical protein